MAEQSEARREYSRRYYQQNKDKWKERYEKNYEYLQAYQRQRYVQNVDRILEYQRSYRKQQTNPTVYVMTNTITGKRYVGSALLYRGRQAEHKWALKNGVHYCEDLQKDFDEHGWGSFSFTILERNIDEEYLRARELYWYQQLRPEYNTNVPRLEDRADEPLPIRKRPH